MGMILEWGMVCDRGSTRTENQDAALLLLPTGTVRLPLADPAPTVLGGYAEIEVTAEVDAPAGYRGPSLFVMVADGMGGPPGGAQASQIIRDTAERVVPSLDLEKPAAALRQLMEIYDREVFKEAEAHGLHGMGSTCTMLLLAAGTLHLCHVGDSRCYRMRVADEKIEQWSRDQNVAAQLVEEGVLTPEEARNHRASHALTQAVGLGKPLLPQIESTPLPVEMELFLLCSDGLLRVVEEYEIQKVFAPCCRSARERSAAEPTPLQSAVEELLELANRRGSPDNVTLAALCLRPR